MIEKYQQAIDSRLVTVDAGDEMAIAGKEKRRRAKPRLGSRAEHTRRKILDAAERLFAARGYSDVSLREILLAARVNGAAGHYHFGSKEALFEAVFSRAAQPVKERVMARLDAAEEMHDERRIEAIIAALIVPSLRGLRRSDELRHYNNLRARLFLEDRAFARRLFAKSYAEVTERIVKAMKAALPHLGEADIAWRCHIMVASLVFTTTPAGRVHPFPPEYYDPENPQEAIAFLVPLLSSMFRAPRGGSSSGEAQGSAALPSLVPA